MLRRRSERRSARRPRPAAGHQARRLAAHCCSRAITLAEDLGGRVREAPVDEGPPITIMDSIPPGTMASTQVTEEERQLLARNHGLPAEALRYDTTPIGMHYLLTHYDVPAVDPVAAW